MGHKKAQKAQKRISSHRSAKRTSSPTVRENAAARSTKRSRKGAKTQTTANEITPTLGDLDLHLFGEGKHLRIYDKLGAHAITHEGKPGGASAAGAPRAGRV